MKTRTRSATNCEIEQRAKHQESFHTFGKEGQNLQGKRNARKSIC